ncbi:MAG: methylmalonyl-CoA epimerase [Rhodovibrionaceae bacterium]
MIGKLNHVAIAVPDLEAASAFYRDVLRAALAQPQDQPDHGVRVVRVELGESQVELMEPLGPDSPIAKFLARNPRGGIHHLCYSVADIRKARDELTAAGIAVLGDGEPKIGGHGKPVLFLRPADSHGALIELEED